MMLASLSLVSCDDDTPNDTPQDNNVNEQEDNESLESIGDFNPEILDNSTTIHMIQNAESLEDWQAGKTVYDVFFYVEDMMELLDSLDWKDSEQIIVTGDFHFRIDIERPVEEISDFEAFVQETEDTAYDIFTVSEGHEKLAVQYLINFDENIVNMRLLNYSMKVFDIYAELDADQLKILKLCLKAYFGPQDR